MNAVAADYKSSSAVDQRGVLPDPSHELLRSRETLAPRQHELPQSREILTRQQEHELLQLREMPARQRTPETPRAKSVNSPPRERVRALRLPGPLVWTVIVAAVIYWGMHAHLDLYISPKTGLGYWLGIIGGSMMALLLIYSARKRAAWLRWMGGIPTWFEIHMVLGVVGPILILFHANFHLGASNSNVALISMLLVAGSGVVGRYIYTRLHARMDGHQYTLEQLKQVGERLRQQAPTVEFLPGVMDAVERAEKRFIEPPPGLFARIPHLLTGGVRSLLARWLVRREIRRAIKSAITRRSTARGAAVIARHAIQLGAAARRYANRRLDAGRRTAEYRAYARLFSYWHVLHIPIFFMLLISAIVHIIAVNVY